MYTLSGNVIDVESQEPLEYATIVIQNSENPSEVTGGITDSNGKFSIEVKQGTYNISIDFISFKSYKLENKTLTADLNLGTVQLDINSEQLDEVEVVAEKSTVEIKLDKRIYNVGKDMTVKGGTAADVLDNVPSVSVDVEGNVSLRGNENVRILINGKPSGLIGLSSTEALRQFPADAILKVEVITSPSARYDAEGTAGILNIILRKGKGDGFNGSLTATGGTPELYGLAGNANYRNKGVNIFTNAGFRSRTGPGNSSVDATYLDDTGAVTGFRDERLDYDRQSDNFNVNFGTEVFLTDRSSITGTALYRTSSGQDISTNDITDFLVDSTIDQTSRIIEIEDEEDDTFEYSFNYTNNFDGNGKKLTLDFQQSFGEELEQAMVSNTILTPTLSDEPAIRTSTDDSNVEYLIAGDFVKPIKENSQFEAGFRFNLDDQETIYTVENENATGGFDLDTDFSNTLNFKQNVYAFYSQYGSKLNDKFSFLLGLRTEFTDIDIDLLTTGENFDKNFSQVFPTVNLGYEINDKNSLTAGYSRRLRRPRSWFLNPFRSFTSLTSFFTGNVDLNPTFTNSFDIGHLVKFGKVTLNSSIYYQRSINNFQFVSTETGDFFNTDLNIVVNPNDPDFGTYNPDDLIPVIQRRPINLSTEDRYGFEFTANYNVSKAVRFDGSFNFFKFTTDGDFSYVNTAGETITQNFDNSNSSWTARFNSRVRLPGEIDWQTRLFYRGAQVNAQSESEGIFSTNLAFSKDLFKEKATLSFNVSDLFNSRKRRARNFTPSTVADNEFQWRERQFTLNFIYRFNQKKKRQRPQRDYGGEEEGGFGA
ncbi:MAG: TonB-dependent receptor [Flavobacteriaceae bacterium]|nr:TonB-dependent receptor [Flavobacteriaceae bacterium]